MGLFPLRRSSSMCGLKSEVSQTTENAFLPPVSPGSLCNSESGSKSGRHYFWARGRETSIPLTPCDSIPLGLLLFILSGSCRQHVLATKDLQCHVGRLECHPLTTLNYSPALGIEFARGGKCPLPDRPRWTHVCIHQKPHGSSSWRLSSHSWETRGRRADCSGKLLHSQGARVSTIHSPGGKESMFFKSHCMFSRMASGLDDLCVSVWWL